MINTRRQFIRDTSLTATGVMIVSPIVAKKINSQKTAISCGPAQSAKLAGTISSVQSGRWSDSATWGGRVPGAGDTPLIQSGHVVVFDLDETTVAGVNINNGGTLEFAADKTGTLLSSANVVVEGILKMRPSSAAVVQTLRFINVRESNFVGGTMDPVASDVGLWVMGSGTLDLVGTTKTSWTNARGAIASGATSITVEDATGWREGDEIIITPTEPPSVGQAYIEGFDERTIRSISGNTITLNSGTARPHPMVNNKWTAEVLNLTRNVRIEGTESGRAHVFIRSMRPQVIQHVGIRYMGPRKNRGGSSATELVTGRYGMHFHHCMEGSRGTRVLACVIRDTNNHAYVPHVSHGIKFIDNVSYNTLETAFWWDPGDETHDAVYDHNVVAKCNFVPGSLNQFAEDAPTFSSSGFAMNSGDDNICINNVVVGGCHGDPHEGGGYNWEAVLNEGIWKFQGNLAHNNENGLRVWQNTTRNHVVEDYIAYNNKMAIFHGAYANSYTYIGGVLYGNSVTIKAASANSNRVRFIDYDIDGANVIDYGFEVIHSPLPGAEPVFIRNSKVYNCKVAALLDSAEPEVHSTDVIHCDMQGKMLVAQNAASGETIRVQPKDGQAYQITKSGTSNIQRFTSDVWGSGKGLKGEYYNGTDFNSHAFTRLDSNVSFSEWSAGVHHKITGQQYSVRWTGKIMPQYTESYTFYVGSGGGHRLWVNNKLILDSWQEHFPDRYQSSSIDLEAGKLYDIKLEFFNRDGGTGMGLYWSSKSQKLEYVPQSQLYADGFTQEPDPEEPANQSPKANAGPDVTITLPTNSTTLNGTASADPDGTIKAYKWTKVSGPTQFTIADSSAASTRVSNLVAGTYVFRLQVTDDKGATNEDDVTVKVMAEQATNQPPVARAGNDVVISLPENSVNLSGSASADPDGTIAKYAWTKVSGPAGGNIASPASVNTAITNLAEGVYVYRLTVTDNDGATAQDEVTVTVKGATQEPTNGKPVANAGQDITIALPANSVTLDGSQSRDADGSIVKYAWSKVSGPGQFSIASPSSATTRVSNLVEGTYLFRLVVTDDKGETAQDDVVVTVKAGTSNRAPRADAGSDVTMTLPTNSTTLEGRQSYDPDGGALKYKRTKVSGPSQFTIADASAATTKVSNLVEGAYVFRLTVTDDAGATASDDVSVIVIRSKAPEEVKPLAVKASPNPTRFIWRISIEGRSNLPISLRVYNTRGNVVESVSNLTSPASITLGASLRAGYYTAVVQQGTQRQIVKLLKL